MHIVENVEFCGKNPQFYTCVIQNKIVYLRSLN